jgi:CO/xanthine dehydrogenase Mo-binding subunit
MQTLPLPIRLLNYLKKYLTDLEFGSLNKTNLLSISKYYVIHDSGKILNENVARGQIIGSTFHGIEVSLYASLEYDENGTPIYQTFAEYCVMSAMESPNIEIEHIQSSDEYSAGLGEGGTMAAPPAILNAIRSIIGKSVQRIPLYQIFVK